MASVLAIVSKAQFEELARRRGGAKVGDVLGLDRYDSTHRALSPLESGGDLFLVTVRPDDVLWLVGILVAPKLASDHWASAPSTIAIADATAVKNRLRFANGKGVPTEAGKLGMSLQTPRALTAEDEKLLRGLVGAPAPAPAPARASASAPARAPAKATGWLAEADLALRDGDARSALRTLLSAWRDNRNPVLAETIEELSAFVTKDAPALVGKKVSEKVAAWNARAEAADPADFGVLAQNLFLVNSGKEVGAHLEQLGQWPADPRLSSLLHELAIKVPFTATSARPFWRSLFTVLPKVGDPRTPHALDAADANFPKVFEGREDYLTYLPNQTKKVRAALANVVAKPLDEATVAGLASMRAFVSEKAKPTHGAAQLSSLLDAVYEDPTADAPREVLADALLDAGDPRGEFLVLQMGEAHGRTLSREEKRREKELLEEHADAWLGPLAGWTRKGDRGFRRGFLARCTIEQKGRNAGPFPDTPAWSTVEEAMSTYPLGFAALRRFRAVKRLRGLAQEAFVEAARGPTVTPHLEELLVVGKYSPEHLEAVGNASGFPSLRRLRYVFRGMSDAPRPDVQSLLGAFERLEHLTWLRMELGITVRRPGYFTNGVDVALARDGGEVVAHVRLQCNGQPFDPHFAVLRELALLAPFLARTKVVTWQYRGYAYDPLPPKRLEATGLPDVETTHEELTGEEASDQENQV